jgi:putative salt-induced outer membrane protein YdiY
MRTRATEANRVRCRRASRSLHPRSFAGRLSIVVLVLCACALPAFGKNAEGVSDASDLSKPCTGQYDWIHLTSAEWLKGELYGLRLETLEFKSKKIKKLTLKWKDVAELCISRIARFVIEDGEQIQGIGRVSPTEVSVFTARGEITFPRDRLMAILPGQATERERWSLISGLGIDANIGNTEQTAINASLELKREARRTRIRLAYYGSYGTANQESNVNRHRIVTVARYYATRYFFLLPFDATTSYDKFQNILIRTTPGVGLGYQIFDLSAFEWLVQGGLGYQYVRFLSVEPGQPLDQNDMTIKLGTQFKWEITSDLDFDVEHETTLVPTDFGQTTLFTRARLAFELTDLLKLEVSTIWNWMQQPTTNLAGETPDQNDLQLVVGFSFELM